MKPHNRLFETIENINSFSLIQEEHILNDIEIVNLIDTARAKFIDSYEMLSKNCVLHYLKLKKITMDIDINNFVSSNDLITIEGFLKKISARHLWIDYKIYKKDPNREICVLASVTTVIGYFSLKKEKFVAFPQSMFDLFTNLMME